MKVPGRIFKTAIVVSGMLLMYNACKKTEVNVSNANLKVLNLSPDAPGLDLYINSKLVASNIPFADSTAYDSTAPGTYFAEIKKNGQTDALFNFTTTLPPSRYYTLFTVGMIDQLRPVLIEDERVADTSISKIRFFHFVPNGDTMNVYFLDTDTTSRLTYTKRRFSDQDSTTNLQQYAGMIADTCRIYIQNSRDSSTIYTSEKMIFQKGKLYTFYLQGLKGATGATAMKLKEIQQ